MICYVIKDKYKPIYKTKTGSYVYNIIYANMYESYATAKQHCEDTCKVVMVEITEAEDGK